MLSIIVAADSGPQELRSHVEGLAPAVDTLESQGIEVGVYIVPTISQLAQQSELLCSIEGACVTDPRRNAALAWQWGVEETTEPLMCLTATSTSANYEPLVEALSQMDQTSTHAREDRWLLAHRAALIAAGSPGRFAHVDDASSVLTELVTQLAEMVLPIRMQGSLSPGFSQAQIDITHPSALEIGMQSYIGMRSLIRSAHAVNPIRIGSYCSMSGEVQILALRPRRHVFFDRKGERVDVGLVPQHAAETATTFPINLAAPEAPFLEIPDNGTIVSDPLIIGNDVWIGWGARIVGPATIGDGAVISAGSVVLGDVPPYAVVAGNPATVIRTRFSQETIDRLLKLRWWNWPEQRVKANWWWFTQPVKVFLDHFESEINERELHV
jgi:acetyltransferase-like isoleucine patch superfamily enzyme